MDIGNIISEINRVEHGFTHIIEAGNQLLLLSDMDHLHIADGVSSEMIVIRSGC